MRLNRRRRIPFTSARQPALIPAVLISVAIPAPVWAWGYVEHESIGIHAYHRACDEVGELLHMKSGVPKGSEERYGVSCGLSLREHDRLRKLQSASLSNTQQPEQPGQKQPALASGRNRRRTCADLMSEDLGSPPTHPAGPCKTDVAEGRALSNGRERVYGQASAIAGDMLATPEEFFLAEGEQRVLNTESYWLLALVNSSHFQPESLGHWREHHVSAIKRALQAAHLYGAGQAQAFEYAFHLNAFADHFLQDSFAAGHMGFNRPASTVAASYQYHGHFNETGRYVQNNEGRAWTAYGDGYLSCREDDTNKEQVIRATVESVKSLLMAFVFMDEAATDALDRKVEEIVPSGLCAGDWRGAPAVPIIQGEANDALQRVGLRSLPAGDIAILETGEFQNRAFKDRVASGAWYYGMPDFRKTRSVQGATGNYDWTLFTDSLRFFLSAGVMYEPRATAAVGVGTKYQVGTSFHGFIGHELVGAALAGPARSWRTSLVEMSLGYKGTAELGPFVLGVQVGPSGGWVDGSSFSFGYMAVASFGYVISSAGGGPL